jgi:hypothetical protein
VKYRISLSLLAEFFSSVQHQFFVPVIAAFGQIQFWTYKENLPIEADDTAIITNISVLQICYKYNKAMHGIED